MGEKIHPAQKPINRGRVEGGGWGRRPKPRSLPCLPPPQDNLRSIFVAFAALKCDFCKAQILTLMQKSVEKNAR